MITILMSHEERNVGEFVEFCDFIYVKIAVKFTYISLSGLLRVHMCRYSITSSLDQ